MKLEELKFTTEPIEGMDICCAEFSIGDKYYSVLDRSKCGDLPFDTETPYAFVEMDVDRTFIGEPLWDLSKEEIEIKLASLS